MNTFTKQDLLDTLSGKEESGDEALVDGLLHLFIHKGLITEDSGQYIYNGVIPEEV